MWTLTRMQRSHEHETTGQSHGYEIIASGLGYDMKTSIEWMEVVSDESTVGEEESNCNILQMFQISIIWQFLLFFFGVWRPLIAKLYSIYFSTQWWTHWSFKTSRFFLMPTDIIHIVSSCRQNVGSNPDWVFLKFNVGDHHLLQEVQCPLISSLWRSPCFPEGCWAEPDPQCEY